MSALDRWGRRLCIVMIALLLVGSAGCFKVMPSAGGGQQGKLGVRYTNPGHIALPRMLKAGLLLDLAGIPVMVGTVWAITALTG